MKHYKIISKLMLFPLLLKCPWIQKIGNLLLLLLLLIQWFYFHGNFFWYSSLRRGINVTSLGALTTLNHINRVDLNFFSFEPYITLLQFCCINFFLVKWEISDQRHVTLTVSLAFPTILFPLPQSITLSIPQEQMQWYTNVLSAFIWFLGRASTCHEK